MILKNCGKGFLVGTILGFFWIGVSAGFLLFSHHLIVVEKNEVNQIWIADMPDYIIHLNSDKFLESRK